MQKAMSLLVFWSLALTAMDVCGQRQGTNEPERSGTGNSRWLFDVKPDESYSDFVQFEDGHAQGVLVFYFTKAIGDKNLNRAVVFCSGSNSTGRSYEDKDNQRLVVSRPLADFAALSRYQSDAPAAAVYGVWETAPDGKVVKFAVQSYRKGNSRPTEPPALGEQYTGRKPTNGRKK